MAQTSRSADLTSGPMLQKIILFSIPLAASSILQLLFNAADVVVVGRFADMLPALRKMLRLRYALLPYLYSTFMKAALENTSYFRPLGFDFPADPDAREVQDQLLLGEGVMVAPVYTQNASGRHVYLPEAMKLYRIRSVDDYDTELLPSGHHYVRCALDEVLLFIRPGHAVPVARPASCTAQLDDTALTLWACPDENGSARCRMYTDDGETSDFAAPEHWKTVEA